MATFRKKGNGWEAAIYMRGVRKSRTFPTKTMATHWAADEEKEIMAGRLGQIPNKTFGDLLKRYASDVSPKKKGGSWEVKRINAILRHDISKLMLSDMSKVDFATWRDFRLKEVIGSTVNREMNLLSHALNTAINDWGWIHENPMKGVKRPQESPPRDRIMTDKEIDRLLFALGYDYDADKLESVSSRVGAAMLFAIETAMRASEICKLTWQDVDTENRVAALWETKNGTKRKVPLSSEAVRIIKQLRNTETESVFDLATSQIDPLFRKARKRTLIDDLHFHDSRHTAITRLAKKLNVLGLARIVGHKDLRNFQIYYNETAEELAKKLD